MAKKPQTHGHTPAQDDDNKSRRIKSVFNFIVTPKLLRIAVTRKRNLIKPRILNLHPNLE